MVPEWVASDLSTAPRAGGVDSKRGHPAEVSAMGAGFPLPLPGVVHGITDDQQSPQPGSDPEGHLKWQACAIDSAGPLNESRQNCQHDSEQGIRPGPVILHDVDIPVGTGSSRSDPQTRAVRGDGRDES